MAVYKLNESDRSFREINDEENMNAVSSEIYGIIANLGDFDNYDEEGDYSPEFYEATEIIDNVLQDAGYEGDPVYFLTEDPVEFCSVLMDYLTIDQLIDLANQLK